MTVNRKELSKKVEAAVAYFTTLSRHSVGKERNISAEFEPGTLGMHGRCVTVVVNRLGATKM